MAMRLLALCAESPSPCRTKGKQPRRLSWTSVRGVLMVGLTYPEVYFAFSPLKQRVKSSENGTLTTEVEVHHHHHHHHLLHLLLLQLLLLLLRHHHHLLLLPLLLRRRHHLLLLLRHLHHLLLLPHPLHRRRLPLKPWSLSLQQLLEHRQDQDLLRHPRLPQVVPIHLLQHRMSPHSPWNTSNKLSLHLPVWQSLELRNIEKDLIEFP